MNDEIVRVENLNRIYRLGHEEVHAIRDVNLTVRKGEFVAIMGPSGSGKSTFLNQLGCLDRPTSGRYILAGTDVSRLNDDELAAIRGRTIGFVFQRFNLLARTTAIDNVELPLLYQGGSRGSIRARRLLETFGLPERAEHRPQELSGGEQQRVAFARALVNAPSVILADEPTGNLDSQRSEEIMQLLCDLNRSGMTIILITHEEDIARYAARIVRFRDGEVVSDEPVLDRTVPPAGEIDLPSTEGAPIVGGGRLGARIATTGEYVASAVRSLLQNRLRAGLTMLGILIGVAAVIALVSIGQGAEASVRAQIEGLGTNLITVVPDTSRTRGSGPTGEQLTWQHAQLLRDSIPGLVGVAPEVSQRTQVRFERESRAFNVIGTTGAYPAMRNWEVAEGWFFSEGDVDARAHVAVLGARVADDLFPYRGALGQRVRIGHTTYEVVGVMTERGGFGFQSNDNAVFVPITTAIRRLTGSEQVRSIAAQVGDRAVMEQTRGDIATVLRADIGVRGDGSDVFSIMTQDDVLSTMQSVTGTLTMLLASIAAISLLVGGIGIMNIMLVSVSERTREIGIRKAIGARRRDVMVQFLSEAMILAALGGLLGWLAGTGAARLVAGLMDVAGVISLETVVVAIGFSTLVGVFFGWYPARKASGLDPIEALRYE